MYPYFILLIVTLCWVSGVMKHPNYAILAYIIVYFNLPEYQWWGYKFPELRYSLIASIFLVFCYAKNIGNLPYRPIHNEFALLMLICLFLVMIGVSSFSAVNPEASWYQTKQFFKILVPFFIIIKTVSSVNHFKLLLYVYLLNFMYLGYAGRDYFTGIRLDGVGVSDASDANLLAAFILLIIPFLLVNFMKGKNWEKVIVLLSAPLILNLFALTRSRGGFVGIVIAFASFFIITKNFKEKLKIIIILLACGCALFSLFDQSYRDRLMRLFYASDKTEQSAGRYEIWTYGLHMLGDYPFGVGGEGFAYLSRHYLPEHLVAGEIGHETRVVHNTFLQVLIEQGYMGLLFYLMFAFFTLYRLHSLRKILFAFPDDEDNRYIIHQSYALESALIGFWGASLFIDRIYFEGVYHFCALSSVLYYLANESVQKKVTNR